MGQPATLVLSTQVLAYGDAGQSSNPRQRHADWLRTLSSISVENAKSVPFTVDPGSELLVFDGSRTTLADNTTEWSLSLSSLGGGRYRFTATDGTAPALRTSRNLTLSGATITVVVNSNSTVTMTTSAGSFAGVQVGDVVFVPGPTTGDVATAFSAANEGYWQVLGVSGATVTLARPTGEDFQGAAEAPVLTSNGQLQAFSSSGVMVGDSVEVSAGFATPALKAYEVVAVNPEWFEVISTSPLAEETDIAPGASGIMFYSAAKRLVYIEADQECAIKMNGSSETTQRMSPWVPGDRNSVAMYLKVGPTWALSVLNRSTSPLNILVISAE